MKDYKVSINANCHCTQSECPIKGNCVLCVQNHLIHKRHIPECIENLLRPSIEFLSKQVEFDIKDKRPTKEFWDNFDKAKFVNNSLSNHKNKNEEKK
jgi:hypothetical protein